jgi:hypothetical protein
MIYFMIIWDEFLTAAAFVIRSTHHTTHDPAGSSSLSSTSDTNSLKQDLTAGRDLVAATGSGIIPLAVAQMTT